MKVYKFKFDYYTDRGLHKKGKCVVEGKDSYKEEDAPSQSFYKEFVENNPDIFEECTKEWLLKEAERRYPIGTRFRSAIEDCLHDDNIVEVVEYEVPNSQYYYIREGSFKNSVYAITRKMGIGACIYNGKTNKWAEIVREPLFTTEDGVDIYEGDEVWLLKRYNSDDRYIVSITSWGEYFGNKGKPVSTDLAFSTEEATEESLRFLGENDEMYSVREIKDAFDRLNSKSYPFDLDITAEQLIKEMQ